MTTLSDNSTYGPRRRPSRFLGVVATFIVGATVTVPIYVTMVLAASYTAPTQSCDTASVMAADPGGVKQVEDDAQASFHEKLNELRSGKGLRTLVWNEPITGPSIEWSEIMSSQIPPGGDASDPGWLHHARDTGSDDGVTSAQDYVNINSKLVANWSRLAENVGVGGMRRSCNMGDLRNTAMRIVNALHDAFVNSPGHYKNMVGDHNQVGIGVHIDDDELWVTVRFANGDLPRATSERSGTVTPEIEAYVDEVYQIFLARSATDAETRRWAGPVGSGDRMALTRELAVSDQWSGVRVTEMYRTVLKREANSQGRRYWVSQIARGLTLEAAAVEFYASQEYYGGAGGDDGGFIRSLYDDLLGRRADANGVRYWKSLLREPDFGQREAAESFYLSVESRQDRAFVLFREVFGRAPSDRERDAWADRLASTGDVLGAAEMAASQAFWSRSIS